jgi:hypothetical protein
MNNSSEFQKAKALYLQIKKTNPNITVNEFLSHLADNAIKYNLVFGASNGT